MPVIIFSQSVKSSYHFSIVFAENTTRGTVVKTGKYCVKNYNVPGLMGKCDNKIIKYDFKIR